MGNKINVAELLRNCPKGMELDCVMWENVKFECVEDESQFPYPIKAQTEEGMIHLTKYGCYNGGYTAKCVIFPKGKTTWEGFVPPCSFKLSKFKDGDIVSAPIYIGGTWIGIFKQYDETDETTFGVYCSLTANGKFNLRPSEGHVLEGTHLATEEEKDKFFKVIKDFGYKWNEETKTLDRRVEPKFKVGDRIKHVVGREEIATVIDVKETHYTLNSKVGTSAFTISLQCEWELVPNKFDISTLKPFKSEVLARDSNTEKWKPNIWGFYDKRKERYRYNCCGNSFAQCIPYKDNEHLLGKTDDCDEFYKTWED